MMGKRKRTKINRDLPPVGTTLQGSFKGNNYKAKIVKDKLHKSGRAKHKVGSDQARLLIIQV